jgi:hypothetical protein
MEGDVSPDPLNMRLLRSDAVVLDADDFADAIKQPERVSARRGILHQRPPRRSGIGAVDGINRRA